MKLNASTVVTRLALGLALFTILQAGITHAQCLHFDSETNTVSHTDHNGDESYTAAYKDTFEGGYTTREVNFSPSFIQGLFGAPDARVSLTFKGKEPPTNTRDNPISFEIQINNFMITGFLSSDRWGMRVLSIGPKKTSKIVNVLQQNENGDWICVDSRECGGNDDVAIAMAILKIIETGLVDSIFAELQC